MGFNILAAIGSILFLVIPGIPLSFALLKGTAFSRYDKVVFGIILGLIAVPLLSFLEFFLLGIKFSALLVVANALLVLFASAGWLYYQKHEFTLPKLAFSKGDEKTYAVLALLTGIMLVGFYTRFGTSWATNFFEFDPYYYEKLTERLVQNGHIPIFSTETYFPRQVFQHWPPLMHYLTGSWAALHQLFTGAGYDQETLILISQLYPPIVGALMSFLVFILIREEYNAYIALIPAVLFAITPQLIKKFAAGVAEQQPWGLFTALLLLTLLVLAIRRRSYRLGAFAALAALASILGSQQHLWPLMVIGAFIGIQGVLDYLVYAFDNRKTLIQFMVVAAFMVGNGIMTIYQQQEYFRFDSTTIIFIGGTMAFYALLHGISKFLPLEKKRYRLFSLVVVFLLIAAAASLTSVDKKVVGTLTSQARIASANSPVGKTVQEEGRTTEDIFPQAFGILNPNHLISLTTLLTLFASCAYLASRKKYIYSGAILLIGLLSIVLNPWIDSFLSALSSVINYVPIQTIVELIVGSDVFAYMLITLAATSIWYLAAEKKSETPLLLVFIFFPIAFIGLGKVKFLVHLAIAVVIVAGYILGESLRLFEYLNDWLKLFSNPAHLRVGVTGILLLAGAMVVTVQAQTVGGSMEELKFTRIPSDWAEAYAWLRENTPSNSRVLSWWDYGHWTTFFGQRNSVLDPLNRYGEFDQAVARAFVDGEDKDLYELMEYHQATHVLVDADLISKWGALVFLSGTCSKQESPVCPEKPETDWTLGPGQSQYELAHYFENLAVEGECPSAISPVPLALVRSGFGFFYCVGQNEYFIATQNGLNTSLKRSYKIVGRDPINKIDESTSYWVPYTEGRFININPNLTPFGIKNNVLKSAFTRFYFLEQFPGFKRVYASRNGIVKIFEYTGKPRNV